ncbi:MAG TPA: phosphate signaling complex protein PhoU [Thermopetrobacter sp.]|nr:phosphate signaling complex protein PhoU [Thermopetrobacter sp.]
MNDSHIVKAFDEELAGLDARITRMGALAAQELEDALQAMRKRDAEQARAVIAADAQVDALEHEVEEGAIHIIALRQPMANDLRAVIGALKAAGELERIGDLASNIARRVITLAKEKPPKPLKKELKRMGRLVVAQLVDVMRAYVERDAALARQVWERDEEVDEHYNALFRELLTYMMEDPRTIGLATHLLFGARNLERIGDHITNIAEQVYFQATGERLDEKRPKGDVTARLMPEAPKGGDTDRDVE